MGEAKLKQTATARLLALHPNCCFCGDVVPAETREHYPPRAIFDNSHRPDGLVVPACKRCNDLSRTADLVAAIISRWTFSEDRSQAEDQDHGKLAKRLRYQAPEIAAEWASKSAGTQQKRARRHLQSFGVPVDIHGKFATIGPLTIPRLNLFCYKLVLAIFFDQVKQPAPATSLIWAHFKTKEDVAAFGIPTAVKDHLGPSLFLAQGQRFNTREQFEYRVAIGENGKLFQVLARVRYGLMVSGFVVTDPTLLGEETEGGWITPPQLESILTDPKFRKKS